MKPAPVKANSLAGTDQSTRRAHRHDCGGDRCCSLGQARRASGQLWRPYAYRSGGNETGACSSTRRRRQAGSICFEPTSTEMAGIVSEGMLLDIGYAHGIAPVLAIPETPVPDRARAG